jgi:tetratricopeptide (TPR) repeat protein
LQESLGNQAAILMKTGKRELAMPLLKEEEQICRNSHNLRGLCAALGNQAGAIELMGKPEDALKMLAEVERLCRQVGSQELLHACLGKTAQVFIGKKQFAEADKLLREKETLCRLLGDKAGLAGAMQGLAIVQEALGNIDAAVHHLQMLEQLGRELHDPMRIANALMHRAQIVAQNLHSPREALPLITEAMQLVENHKLELLRTPSSNVLKLVQWLCEETAEASQKQDGASTGSEETVPDHFWGSSKLFLDTVNSLTVTCCACGEVTGIHYTESAIGMVRSPAFGVAFPSTCENCLAQLLICYRAGSVVHVERITGPYGLVSALKRAEERLTLNKDGQD